MFVCTLGIFMQFLLFYKHSKFAKLSTHKQKIPYIGKLSNSAKFYFAQTFLVRKLKIFLHSKFRKAHACQLQCLCIVGSNLWMSFQILQEPTTAVPLMTNRQPQRRDQISCHLSDFHVDMAVLHHQQQPRYPCACIW